MQPRILIVEDLAHKAAGHYPVLFAELAAALAGLGCQVSALTSEGWAAESRGVFPDLDVRQLGPTGAALRRGAKRLAQVPPRRYTGRASAVAVDALMVLAARATRRRLRADGVIVMCKLIDPFVAATVAGDGSWLFCVLDPPWPPRTSRWRPRRGAWQSRGGRPSPLLLSVSRRAASRRQRRGGSARFASNNDVDRLRWSRATPWFDPVQLPFMAPRPRVPIPDARRLLEFPEQAKIALLFGAAHDLKDYEVVCEAFAVLPEWQLVVAGRGTRDRYTAWCDAGGRPAREPILLDGFVDDATRDLLHAAADLVVLSFVDGSDVESGTLFDAIAWGKPVVCSDRSTPGDAVRELGLGPLFEPGDASSLVAAVRAAPDALPEDRINAARHEFSPEHMAAVFLDALGLAPEVPSPDGSSASTT